MLVVLGVIGLGVVTTGVAVGGVVIKLMQTEAAGDSQLVLVAI